MVRLFPVAPSGEVIAADLANDEDPEVGPSEGIVHGEPLPEVPQ